MYMVKKEKSQRLTWLKKKENAVPKKSIEDIDELTYRLTLGLRAGRLSSVAPEAIISKTQASLLSSERKLSVSSEIEELPEQIEVPQLNLAVNLEESTSSESEETKSDVSISQKIKCFKFLSIETFAQLFVDEIIDVSLEVCDNLNEAAIGEDVQTEIPCICDSVKVEEAISNDSIDDESNGTKSSMARKFSGWPTIESFSIEKGKKRIMEFMADWYFVEDWKYTVLYYTSYSDSVSDFHLYQGMWSIPTKEYPVAQATATVFFTIEVSRVLPKFCLVNVTLQFEGSSSVYRAGQFEFIEQWLFNIIDSKLNLFKTLRF